MVSFYEHFTSQFSLFNVRIGVNYILLGKPNGLRCLGDIFISILILKTINYIGSFFFSSLYSDCSVRFLT